MWVSWKPSAAVTTGVPAVVIEKNGGLEAGREVEYTMYRFIGVLQKLFGESWLHGESIWPRFRKKRLRSRLLPGRRATTSTDSMDGLGIYANGKSLITC